MGQMIYCPHEEACGPDVGCEVISKRRGNKPRPKTEGKTMLGMSPADIMRAIDLVDDLIQDAQSRCTDRVRARQLRTLVLEFYRWRREEAHRWESR